MPVWPFVITTLLGICAFGFLSERNDWLSSRARFVVVLVTGIASIIAWGMLFFSEPWHYEDINVASHGRRGAIFAALIEFCLAVGPQITSFLFLAVAGAAVQLLPKVWRAIPPQPGRDP